MPPGVRSARLNVMARSVIIEYDASRIAPALVEELLSAKDDRRAAEALAELDAILRTLNAQEA